MKELFVFGAGASKDSADTPLGMELVWKYYQDCCMWAPITNGVPDNSGANEDFINYVSFLTQIGSFFPEFKNEVDNFLNRGIMMYGGPYELDKRHYIDDLLRRVYDQRNDSFAELLRQLIFEHIVGAGFARSNKSYLEFCKKVKVKESNNISIISFNFDFLLHEDFYNDVYFDYILDFDFIDENRNNIYKRLNPIPFVKLNGSLDWGKCTHCNKLHLFYPHMDTKFYKQRKCEFCTGNVSPYIVIPHEKYNGNINLLWEASKEYISNASRITIIGYSFPEYDTKVVELFRESIKRDTKLIVVDYIENGNKSNKINQIQKKYSKLFPDLESQVEVLLDGFTGYLRNHI